MTAAMDVSFVIVNWNTAELLKNCIASIYSTVNNKKFEVIVVDNASNDDSVELIQKIFPAVKLIRNSKNLGFSRAVNVGLRLSSGKYLILLNTDTILQKHAVNRLIDFMDSNKNVGICGGQLIYEDGRKQNSFDNYPSLLFEIFNKSLLKRLFPRKYYGKFNDFIEPVEVESIIGACFVISRVCMEKIGLLDEDYFFFIEETDYCYRANKQGFSVVHVPQSKIVHFQGVSAKKIPVRSRMEYFYSKQLFFKKNKPKIQFLFLIGLTFMKCVLKIVAYFLLCVLTLFMNEKLKQKLKLYANLLAAHIMCYPAGMRMKGSND